ncbi:MAG: hypothetical protein ACE5DN_00730 [Flavobacteriales bacterium]
MIMKKIVCFNYQINYFCRQMKPLRQLDVKGTFKQNRMRRTAIALALLMLGGMTLTSCKSHERCPAYGKIEKSTATQARTNV